MSTEEDLVKHLDQVNLVVEEYLKGNDPTVISKQLSIPRQKVVTLINEWKVMASANDAIRARAKEALAAADTHYSKLVSRTYEVIDEASMTNNLSAKTAAIKLVMDIESKRIDMLQKAGLLEDNELADQLMETERKQEVLVSILKEVTSDCDHCKFEVAKRLSQVTGKLEAVNVD